MKYRLSAKVGCYSLDLDLHFLMKEIRERKSKMPKIRNSVQSSAKCEIITENMWPVGARSAKSLEMSGGSSPAKKRSAKSSIVPGSTSSSQVSLNQAVRHCIYCWSC